MSLHLLISDQQTRYLPDGALIGRLANQIETGIRAGGSTILVGGHTLPQAYDPGDGENPTDFLQALRHPHGQAVTHHTDGTTDVTVTVGIQVHIHPAGGIQ